MAINKQNWNSKTKTTSLNNLNFKEGGKLTYEVARVIDIILDDSHPRFNEVGGWKGVRSIIFSSKDINFSSDGAIAYPLNPQIKTTPLKEELVLIFTLPSTEANTSFSGNKKYYLNTINLWNSPHYNGYPNLNKKTGNLNNTSNNYLLSSQGVQNTPNIISNEIPNFEEKGNLRPLLTFCGDSIYEGRFGNGIRIGSTFKSNSTYKNNWSEGTQTQNGDPLIIIRNGQKESKEAGFIPITEDINEDPNSLYFTSTQKIPFKENIEDKFNQKTNWKFRPISPKNFDKSQIIGNSDRILFNAKTDSLLFGAQKNINFSCIEDININSRNLYTDYNNIKLGGKDATESLIKGDLFLDNLEIVLNNLSVLCDALQSSNLWPEGVPVPNNPVITTSINLKSSVEGFVNQINSYKSKISKTI